MQMTVGTSAVRLNAPASSTPIVQNLGPGSIFIGDSTVTVATGIKLGPGDVYEFLRDLSQSFGSLYLVADAAGTDVRYLVVG